MVLPLGVREPGADSCALQTVEARDQDHKSNLAASLTASGSGASRTLGQKPVLFSLTSEKTCAKIQNNLLNLSASAAAAAAGSAGRRPRRRARRRRRLC